MVNMTLLLASNSPRRRELLSGLDIPWRPVALRAIAEDYPPDLKAGEIPLYIARGKMAAYDLELKAGEVLVTADTIVWCDQRMLGKPEGEEEAAEMLRFLSGKIHQVYTGVCLKSVADEVSFVCRTDVTFAPLTEEQIRHYVKTYRPLDKAGAYGIQEWIGYVGVTSIEGSYFNVMGLPVQRLYAALQKLKMQ